MYLLVDFLQKNKKIDPEQIFYFDLENIIFTEQLNKIKNFEQFIKNLETEGADLKKRAYIFIDEIQYLDYPSKLLKYVYDHYKGKIKFIVSGSSTLDIKRKFTDRLTGRVHIFTILPLSFYEYLYFKKDKQLIKQKQDYNLFKFLKSDFKLQTTALINNFFQEHFERFTLFGSYPGISLKTETQNKIEDLANIYSLYIRKDIKDIGQIDDIKGFNNLVGLLANQIGSLINESELSISTGLSRPTIKKYLALLENTFVCHLLRPFFTNTRLEYRKMPKIYFIDIGLRNAAINNFNQLDKRSDTGHLIENIVFEQLLKQLPKLWEIHFWRSERGAEVDFVLKADKQKLVPIEVKYQSFKKAKIPSGLRSFIKRYNPEKAFVITRDFYDEQIINKTKIIWLPAWVV